MGARGSLGAELSVSTKLHHQALAPSPVATEVANHCLVAWTIAGGGCRCQHGTEPCEARQGRTGWQGSMAPRMARPGPNLPRRLPTARRPACEGPQAPSPPDTAMADVRAPRWALDYKERSAMTCITLTLKVPARSARGLTGQAPPALPPRGFQHHRPPPPTAARCATHPQSS